ncbi:MAG: helix-turn-helix transcriptional regulator [Gammaproteobacteria bacterium]
MNKFARVSLPEEGFVRLDQILAVYPVGKTSWWEGVRTGRYPQPVKLGPKTTAWRAPEIRQLIKEMGG